VAPRQSEAILREDAGALYSKSPSPDSATLPQAASQPAVLRPGGGPSSSAMEEEVKAGPHTDANNDIAAPAPASASVEEVAAPPPSSSERTEAMEEEGAVGEVLERLAELVEEMAAFSDFRNAYRRQFCNLSRRIRLLSPMLEEAKEAPRPLPVASEAALRRLTEALRGARELLRLGSKIFLVEFLACNSQSCCLA
jgi:hypothetical protein